MDREECLECLDWLYRLRSEIYVFMPKEWIIPMNNALDMAIKALEQEHDAIHNEREQAYMKGYEDASKRYRTEPCDDAISRSDAIRVASGYCHWSNIPKELEKLPSVSTEKTGHWKKIKSGDKNFPESIVCSRCGYENSYINEWNFNNEPLSKVFKTSKYCPNCGAKMREVGET